MRPQTRLKQINKESRLRVYLEIRKLNKSNRQTPAYSPSSDLKTIAFAAVAAVARGVLYTLLARFVYFVVKAVKTTDSLVFYLSCFFLFLRESRRFFFRAFGEGTASTKTQSNFNDTPCDVWDHE